MMKVEKAKKRVMIDTHQNLVCRAFSKSFMKNIERDSMGILECMGLFVDEEVKEVRDSFMPWLYQETFENIKKSLEVEVFIESTY